MTDPSFIALYGSYLSIELALFHKNSCTILQQEPNKRASSILIPMINDLLDSQKLTLQELSFLAIDSGPGAFTSLRVTISTANGIAYASKLPLIGIDGLEALAHETFKQNLFNEDEIIICLLNAYNQEVYIAEFQIKDTQLIKIDRPFYAPITTLLTSLAEKYQNKKVSFTGNGTQLHAALIKNHFGQEAKISNIPHSSAKTVGELGLKIFLKKKELATEIQPLYLKTTNFTTKN